MCCGCAAAARYRWVSSTRQTKLSRGLQFGQSCKAGLSSVRGTREQPMQTCLDDTGNAIVRELYKAVSSLTDDAGLLSCIGSWGDTMDDAEVLEMLKRWNEMGEPFVPDASARG
jgi:hypothetical protein